MKYQIKIILCVLVQTIITLQTGCSNSAQVSQNSSNANSSNVAKSTYKDFTNKPVNLNNQKDKENFDKQIEELNRNRELWKSQNISNYSYYCEVFGGGMTPRTAAKVKILDNKVFSAEEEHKPDHQKDSFLSKKMAPFDVLFNSIEVGLTSGSSVDVKYNKKYGYPEKINSMFSLAFDASTSTRISKFEIIK